MTVASILVVLVWLYLLTARGIFWQAGPVLPTAYPATTPSVAVVVPARAWNAQRHVACSRLL